MENKGETLRELMDNKIFGVIKAPGQKARAFSIENELRALQKAVDGYIEAVPVTETVRLICNEEGKQLGMEHNFFLDVDGMAVRFSAEPGPNTVTEIVGPALFLQRDWDSGEFENMDIDVMGELLNQLWALRARRAK